MTAPRPGVIGLGTIGGGLATALARAGLHPTVYDVRAEAAHGLEGVVVAPTPADVAAASDVIFVAVLDADQVDEVLFGARGVISAPSSDRIAVILSTIGVDTVREFGRRAERAGLALVDAGVSGPPGAAAAGQLVFFVGGDDPDVSVVRQVLADCARALVHLGPVGSGLAGKIARNLVTYGTWTAVHEACRIACAAGLDQAALLDAIATSDPDGSIQLLLARSASGPVGDDAARRASMERMALLIDKDIRAAEDLAAASGIPAPVAHLTRTLARTVVGLTDGEPREPDPQMETG